MGEKRQMPFELQLATSIPGIEYLVTPYYSMRYDVSLKIKTGLCSIHPDPIRNLE